MILLLIFVIPFTGTQYEDEDWTIREVLVKQHMGEENFLDGDGKVFLKRLTSF